MTIPEKLTFGQTYVVQSDGPIKITQTGAHGTLVKVNVTDEAGTAGREVVFTAIDTAATVEVDKDTNWSCVPGFNRGAASVQGGPAEITTDQKTFLQWVTDGKLTFDADGRLKIATSVDAQGTFNHDGYASNYTKTVDGVKYTTTVNAHEVIVKKSESGADTVLMHLHDGVLELGGAPVVTRGYFDMVDSNRLYGSLINSADAFGAYYPLITTQHGDEAMLSVPNYNFSGAAAFGTENDVFSGSANTLRIGNSNTSFKKISVVFQGAAYAVVQPKGNHPATELFVTILAQSAIILATASLAANAKIAFKTIHVDAVRFNVSAGNYSLFDIGRSYASAPSQYPKLIGDWYVHAPSLNVPKSVHCGVNVNTDDLFVFLDMPRMTSAFSFFAEGPGVVNEATRKNKVSEVVYLLDHLGTPTEATSLTSGITSAAGEIKDFEETIGGSTFMEGEWHPTDSELVDALERHPMWSVGFTPVD